MRRRKPDIRFPTRKTLNLGRRSAAASAAHTLRQSKVTKANTDEVDFETEGFPSNFTKGLEHSPAGVAANADAYTAFVDHINRASLSDTAINEFMDVPRFKGTFFSQDKSGAKPNWRGWESPRTGHYYDQQGPDADAVGMAPAPAMGSDELTAEMAEVFAMALMRDMSFAEIEALTDQDPIIQALNKLSYFESGAAPETFANRRRSARFLEPEGYNLSDGDPEGSDQFKFTGANLFRGSGPGAKAGPWVSQFMLVGDTGGGKNPLDGNFVYGSQTVSQKSTTFKPELDYMTNWCEWMDVQNGADVRGSHQFGQTRFLATPRDMATYVRFDALYQAYLNACLIMLAQLGDKVATLELQDGFPDKLGQAPNSLDEHARTGFASFGGPHILSLVTEVATRCLKAARRQKFNWHRRARPEKISGLLTLAALAGGKDVPALGTHTQKSAYGMVEQLEEAGLAELIHAFNQQREIKNASHRRFTAQQPGWLANADNGNLLLAMAFPEGSPMHPAYAAGHATVAGGCVTMLKAFFKTIGDDHLPIDWSVMNLPIAEARIDAENMTSTLCELDAEDSRRAGMTIEGELNKLAANISIGRNMAGVHYYSDYYDSLRMGERVAVGILVEQMQSYDELVTMKLRSFDGDLIEIGTCYPDKVRINEGSLNYLTWVNRPLHDPEASSIGA